MTAALLVFLVLGGERQAPPPEHSPEEQALAAYQRRDYATACRLYRAATEAHPENAKLWADLGLCLHHLPSANEDAAAEAERRAIAAAQGDAGREVRLSAYYNLNLIQGALELPTSGGHTTEIFCEARTDAKCPKTAIHVCAGDRYEGGNGTGETTAFLRFRAGAEPREDDDPSFELQTDVSDVFISSRVCSPRDACRQWVEELPSDAQRAFARWVGACVSAGKKKDHPPYEESCAADLCAELADGPDAAAPRAKVQRLLRAKYEKCEQDRQAEEDRIQEERRSKVEQCRVVHIDVCNHRVGLVCEREGKRVAEEHDVP